MKASLLEVWSATSATRESLSDFPLEGKLRVCLKEGDYPIHTSNGKQERTGPEPSTQKTLD